MLVQQNTDHGFDSLNHTPDPAPFQTKVKRRHKPMTREVLKARGAKIAAAKLAKRATLQCETCSNPFRVARHDLWRKRCPACVRLGKRLSKKKIHAKTCPVCKAPFTAARAETICCSVKCARVLLSRHHKASGHRPQNFVNPEEWRRAVKSKERGEKISMANTGRIRTSPRSRRFSPRHGRAAEFFVRSPDNRVWLVQNITRFVYENESLFDPDAVIWTTGKYKSSIRCFASHGLATIGRGFRQSWRGWTWVSKQEGREGIDNMSELQPSVNEQKDDSS
jgi:hypothetical protein